MKLVGAALGNNIELAACGIAKLGAELIRTETEFLDRVRDDLLGDYCNRRIVVVYPIDTKAVLPAAQTADGPPDPEVPPKAVVVLGR